MRRVLYSLGTAVCLLLILIVITCAAVTHMGRDGALYARCFHAYAGTEHLGVTEDRYDEIAQALAVYLSGDSAEMPYFNEKELTHLNDIRLLFALFDKAWLLLIPAAALVFLLLKRPDPKGLAFGSALAVLILLAIGTCFSVNFEGAFIALHKVLFTNDLWLLAPRTDLLICLMPERMFSALAVQLALTVLPGWLLAATVLAVICVLRKRHI